MSAAAAAVSCLAFDRNLNRKNMIYENGIKKNAVRGSEGEGERGRLNAKFSITATTNNTVCST